jgi:hypothetical protein
MQNPRFLKFPILAAILLFGSVTQAQTNSGKQQNHIQLPLEAVALLFGFSVSATNRSPPLLFVTRV